MKKIGWLAGLLLSVAVLALGWYGYTNRENLEIATRQWEQERNLNNRLQNELGAIKTDSAKGREEASRLQEESSRLKQEVERLTKAEEEDNLRAEALSAKVANQAQTIEALSKKKGAVIVKTKKPDMSWAQGLSQNLQRTFRDEMQKGGVQIKQTEDRLVIVLAEPLLFDPDDVEVTKEGEDFLTRLGEVLKTVKGHPIEVGGHTDSGPIAPSMAREFPTAWEFTGARAVSVARFLEEESKISGRTLLATAYGSARAVATNATETGRAQNRRMEVTLLPGVD